MGTTVIGRLTRLLFGSLILASSAQSQQLSPTPPMGWNSWYALHTNISDAAVREVADALVSSGLRDKGYVYVNLDDGWEGARDASGHIQAGAKFPDMKALAAYLHSRGLRFGIYSSPAKRTPAGFTGSFGHESQDAAVYASWGVDYLKYDWGYASADYPSNDVQGTLQKMRRALDATGRSIVFSVSAPVETEPWKWAPSQGIQLWRNSQDIEDSWPAMSHIGFDIGANLTAFPKAGHWNDPDMLQVGHHGMTNDEYRTQVSLWALLAAPLLISADVRLMTQDDLKLLSNTDVLAIDQDELGRSGYRLRKEGQTEVWARQLTHGAWAVGLFNRGDHLQDVVFSNADAPFYRPGQQLTDLWTGRTVPTRAQRVHYPVPAHDVVLLRLSPTSSQRSR